ncbi:MAG: hypothetical protein E7627_05980 [Ruminococcaceae bacterium]|nr:hypothetical protein [Oscillospiraceae bacterium]
MRKGSSVKLISMLMILFILALVPASVYADGVYPDEGNVPTLFYNDEAWYKDSSSPLVVREGEYYVPAEIFKMFDAISVTTPTSDNLLICNTETGEYISILFSSQSAAVNGEIVRGVGVLKDSGAFYVNAETVGNAVGIKREYFVAENGKTTLRLFDSGRKLSLGTLIKNYTIEEEDHSEGTTGTINVLKRIYILVKSPSNISPEYVAKYRLDEYGLNYTMLLTSQVEIDDVLEASAMGVYGVIPRNRRIDGVDIAAELDGTNELFMPYTKRHARLTLATGNAEEDRILESLGYIPIKPDFTVNGSSDAEAVFTEMIAHVTKYGACTILLEDCWNSGRLAELISEIDYPYYTTSNLAKSN